MLHFKARCCLQNSNKKHTILLNYCQLDRGNILLWHFNPYTFQSVYVQFLSLNALENFVCKMSTFFWKTASQYRIRTQNHCGNILTHWGRVTHICVNKLTTIGSDNGLSPGRRQIIIWTNAGILLIWNLGTNFSGISSEIQAFSFKKMHLKMSSAKWRPFVSASMC